MVQYIYNWNKSCEYVNGKIIHQQWNIIFLSTTITKLKITENFIFIYYSLYLSLVLLIMV